MAKKLSKFQQMCAGARELWDERALRPHGELSRLHKFAHFWVLAIRSFIRNRCPVRASALAYATVLALIPMFAVAMSITSSFLKKEGEDQIDHFIAKFVASVTPPADLPTNNPPVLTNAVDLARDRTNAVEAAIAAVTTNASLALSGTNTATHPGASFAEAEQTVKARRAIARNIHEFIKNTRSGTLGVTGSILLIFVAISMLSRIETTFNDIWGIARGRSWFMRIVLYWGVLSLMPILLIVALGLATGPHLQSTKRLLDAMPVVGPILMPLLFQLLPLLVLCVTFAIFYILIPNTKVRWQAAVVGGFVSGALFHLNNAISVLYVSRVVSNSKIYGSLGLVPVFMIGLYFSWLILLFGAQVAYAFQNRSTYLEEKQLEAINQRGKEFVALRLMTFVSRRFAEAGTPPSITEIGDALAIPTRLVQRVMQTLSSARLVVEASGADPSYVPGRPLEAITCHDILLAMRASQGQELATRDEPTRAEVYGEYCRIQEAERQAASSVTMLAMVTRAEARLNGPRVAGDLENFPAGNSGDVKS
jgi:membrane protein